MFHLTTLKNEVYKCFNHRLLLYAINCISQLASYKKDSTIVPVKSTAIKQKITLSHETTIYHNCQGLQFFFSLKCYHDVFM